jgi:hypothetical protein
MAVTALLQRGSRSLSCALFAVVALLRGVSTLIRWALCQLTALASTKRAKPLSPPSRPVHVELPDPIDSELPLPPAARSPPPQPPPPPPPTPPTRTAFPLAERTADVLNSHRRRMAASDAESAERAAALAAAEAALSSSGALHAAAIGDAALLLHRLSAAAGRAGGALCPSLRTALAPSSAPLPKALRRATLACHPDRHVGAPVAQQVLAGEIFKLLQGVKAPPPPPPPPAAEAAVVAQRAASAVTEQLRTCLLYTTPSPRD